MTRAKPWLVAASVLALTAITASASNHADRPYSLGPIPVDAAGTFTNGQGGCPVATSFKGAFLFFAPGDGTMTIEQPDTGDAVSGTINAGGDYRLRSARESYDGKIRGSRSARALTVVAAGSAITSTAKYAYITAAGCTETYDASFVIDPGPPANPLDRIAARMTCSSRTATGSRRSAAIGRRCTLKVTNTGQRALHGVSFAMPNTSVSGVRASNGGACTSDGGSGICTWRVAFRRKQPRTINFTTTRLIKVGAGVLICASGNPDLTGSYCVGLKVKAPSADLELELFSGLERDRSGTYLTTRVVVTHHGPDTSPSAVIQLRSDGLAPYGFDWEGVRIRGCTAKWQLWTCDVSELAQGERASATLSGEVDMEDLTTIGTVTGPLVDPKPGNNRDSSRATR